MGRAVQIIARSHAGRVRPNNEDSIGFVAEAGIAVLADGMGGLNAGEVASRHAVDLMLQGLTGGLPMQQAVVDANRTIYDLSRNDPELHNMGTTLVALRCVEDTLWMANVGDSRIYRYRASVLTQLTKDHSVVQQLVDGGVMSPAEARVAPNRNIITRALDPRYSRELRADQHQLKMRLRIDRHIMLVTLIDHLKMLQIKFPSQALFNFLTYIYDHASGCAVTRRLRLDLEQNLGPQRYAPAPPKYYQPRPRHWRPEQWHQPAATPATNCMIGTALQGYRARAYL